MAPIAPNMQQLHAQAKAIIENEPGITTQHLATQLELGLVKTAEIIGGLLSTDQIIEENTGNSRRFYTEQLDEATQWLHAHPKADKILRAKNTRVKDLVEELQWPKATIQWYIRNLRQRGLWSK